MNRGNEKNRDSSPVVFFDYQRMISLLSESDDVSDLDIPAEWKPLQDRIHSLQKRKTEPGSGYDTVPDLVNQCTYPLAIQIRDEIVFANQDFLKIGLNDSRSVPGWMMERDINGREYQALDHSFWIISVIPLHDGTSLSRIIVLVPQDCVAMGEDSLFSLLPYPALVLNKAGFIARVNPAFCSMSGKKAPELLYHDPVSVGFPESIRNQCDMVIRTKTPCTIGMHYYSAFGTSHDLNVYMAPMMVVPGQVDRICILISDVDAAKTGDSGILRDTGCTALRNRFLTLRSGLPLATAEIDDAGLVRSVNDPFAMIFGVDPESLIMRKMNTLIPDIIPESDPKQLYIDNAGITREGMVYLPGYQGILEVKTIRMPDAEKTGCGMFLFLIQKIKKGQVPAFLSESGPGRLPDEGDGTSDGKMDWLIEFITSYPAPALICDTAGVILSANQIWSRYTGKKPSEISGMHVHDIISKNTKKIFPEKNGAAGSYPDTVEIHHDETGYVLHQFCVPVDLNGKKLYLFLFSDMTREYEAIRLKSDEIAALQARITVLNETARSKECTRDGTMEQDGAAPGSHEILAFTIHESWFAIDIEMVREIIEMVPITPLPNTPHYICGVINLRGEITTVINLSSLIGSSTEKRREEQKIIVLSPDKTERVNLGLIVDEVVSVQQIEKKQLNILGDDITAHTRTGIKGIIRVEPDERHGEIEATGLTKLVIWLKMEQIIDEIRLQG